MPVAPRPHGVLALAAALLLLGGCETGFDPFQQNDRYFSVFGYLDAAADTQFVRITPLRDALSAGPAPLDAVVTLAHPATGSRVVLRDSVTAFDGGRYVHNFWTAEAVLPGGLYHLRVERPDGAASSATVTLPDTFPDPRLTTGVVPFTELPPVQGIVVTGAAQLAQLDVVLEVRPTDDPLVQRHTLSYLTRLRPSGEGFIVSFNAYQDLVDRMQTRDCPTVVGAEVVVAAAGPGWPDFAAIDEETLALFGVASNVEHGVGFLGGIVRRRVAWPAVLQAMELRRGMCAGSAPGP